MGGDFSDTLGLPLSARVRHEIPGRMRLSIPEAKQNPLALRGLASRVASLAGVAGAEIGEKTGTLLIRFEGEAADLRQQLAAEGLIEVIPATAQEENYDPVSRVEAKLTSADLAVARLSEGKIGLWDAAFVGLVALGCVQVARGNIIGPAFTLFAQAATIAAVRRSRGPAQPLASED